MTDQPDISAFQVGLYDALPISEAATTSRMLVNNPLVRVVTFVMDADQELTEHASPKAVVVQQLAGTMHFTVAGRTETLHPGDVVYLAPGDRHAVVAETPCRFSLVMVPTPGA